ncbi:DNA internalization-related competence protein ComEC Rec2 [Lentilactobacillus senioris DSM 24302 = JCM 17472]|uniref:DNA internalization-related competence protein ComEC Rec2 n=1 Tax=Lentilactobacillus senioris DSM 24302 = JCM 17472 TaxID=1423802 RepID=A0A0R2D0R7_9LACO|nr:DNA internalization-related competence protein ComEC/Rec2 [Lentilactobacillus senioris]KRM94041.1 DNA internalization-related competence protein ComEC Rec2 [Lentilactobacillus senioris DSM 24302 = JCM 17472]
MSKQLVRKAPKIKSKYVANTMFFPGLFLLAISMLLFGNWKLGLVLVSLTLIRIICLRDSKMWGLIALVAIGYLGAAFCFNQRLIEQNQMIGEYNGKLDIYPDHYQIRGDLLTGRAHISFQSQNQTVMVVIPIESLKEQQWLLSQSHPVQLQVTGVIEPVKKPTNFNQFDSQFFYRVQSISNRLIVQHVNYFQIKEALSIVDKIHVIRTQFNHYCQKLPAHLKVYALGLISGYRETDFYEMTPGVTQLGLLHLFSISGMHVTYLLMLVEWGLKWLPDKLRSVLEAVMLIIYFIFAGASVGLLRAVLSAEIKILGRLFNWQISMLDVWSVTLIINLIIFPAACFLLACQFSYALSFGLIILHNRGTISKSFWLSMLSLPIILEHIFEWHCLSLLVNILILPIFSILIIPLVLLGVVLNWANLPGVTLINFIIREFNTGLNFISSLPGMITFGKPGLITSLMLFSLTVAIIIKKRTKLEILLLLVFYSTSFIRIHYPINGEVTMFDVGQGDSFLVRTPQNQSVNIIDTGGRLTFNVSKWQRKTDNYQAERTVINYLKSIGVKTVDNIWISHQDADHCGDLPVYLQKLRVNNVIVPAGMEENPHFLQRLKSGSFKQLIPITDQTNSQPGIFECFHPNTLGTGKNEDSLVLGGTFGQQRWLFTGDLDRDNELKMLRKYPELKTDVLKVGHHGSKTASDPRFIQQLRPQVAWISAGKNNRYNHPNQETIETLTKNNVKIMNTQHDGMIQYSYQANQPGIIKRDAKQRREATHGLLNF